MKKSPNIKFVITAYLFVLAAAGFFVYGVFNFINSPVNEKIEKYRIEKLKRETGIDESSFSDLPLILNRREGCLICHGEMEGFESSHDPQKIGCYSCHLGNRLARDKSSAHKNLLRIPGNSNDVSVTCGEKQCHPQMIARMENNIMTTMNGVVSVDKWVFGETASPTAKSPVDSIKYSPADTHLRNLCASCHLSNAKTEAGPVQELSRGGGCLACHLNYSKESEEMLVQLSEEKNKYENKISKLKFHPSVSLNVENKHCFGCHSRSGRISLSYDGWHETLLKPEDVKGKIGFRILDDGRVVQQIKKDIHSELGLQCVDCHTSYELMGDGKYSLHKEEQMKIQCVDCHLVSNSTTRKISQFEFESAQISRLKKFDRPDRDYLVSAKNGFPLVNVFLKNGKPYLIRKSTGQIIEIKLPSQNCARNGAHKNLSCNSCHNSWSPQCVGCHTEFDKDGSMFDLLSNKEEKGEWLEHPKDLLPEPAVLGVREFSENGIKKKIVEEFIPGMVLTINKDKNKKEEKIFNRLFAPGFSHTIRKETRSCVSCHNNSAALGYGRGKLDFQINGKTGVWKFSPSYYPIQYDGLPEDSWIGFLKERSYNSTTRDNTRPFSISEQKKILTVGACLTCHKPDSWVMKNSLNDFQLVLEKRSSMCVLPQW